MSNPNERDISTKKRLMDIAKVWYDQMVAGNVPSITLPTRTKHNLKYNESADVWTYGSKESTRDAGTAKSAIHMLKMAYVIDFIKMQLLENRSSTLREMYYISEGWKQAKFNAQNESNYLVEDLEIITALQREYFHMRPEEDGASIFGPLKVRENTRRGMKDIHCQDDVGEAGYNIPNNIENVELVDHNATCVIAIETGGMFSRLQENGFDEEYNTILLHLKGQPTRATRRMLKRLNEELKIPVVVFTDGDPWSYRIYASVAYGSIKTAHMSEYLATPSAKFIGVKPSDIRDYNLPADKLTEQDISALKAELSDPRFENDFWKQEINLQLELGLKSEQQAFASRGLDFVTKEYLPTMLSEIGVLKR
ncbi:MAG TPA: DNA topoisomerase IV subunit A [Methanocorpusculum sp.]|nr:DNA topoisomerase IV subunit A [Methanocorpusculum sp.]